MHGASNGGGAVTPLAIFCWIVAVSCPSMKDTLHDAYPYRKDNVTRHDPWDTQVQSLVGAGDSSGN